MKKRKQPKNEEPRLRAGQDEGDGTESRKNYGLLLRVTYLHEFCFQSKDLKLTARGPIICGLQRLFSLKQVLLQFAMSVDVDSVQLFKTRGTLRRRPCESRQICSGIRSKRDQLLPTTAHSLFDGNYNVSATCYHFRMKIHVKEDKNEI